MKKLMNVLALTALISLLFSCAQRIEETNPVMCSIERELNGSKIICPDGTSQWIPDGTTGSTGSTGQTGAAGQNGTNGHNALVKSTSADASLCPSGGTVITSGTDLNNNNILELTEVSSSAVICNGSNGTNGTNGLNSPPTPFTPVALVEPCASNPNNPSASDLANSNLEVFLKLSNGMLIASVSANMSGLDTHFGTVAPNVIWQSTGIGSNCLFSVDSNGVITKH